MTVAATLILIASVALFSVSLAVGAFAYVESARTKQAILIVIGLIAFILSSILFADVIIRLDSENGESNFKIENLIE